MKILQVIPYFIPAYNFGGPVKVCFDISKELVNRGHDVTVVTTDTLDGIKRIELHTEEIEGISIIRFRNISNHLIKYFNGYLPTGFYKWFRNNVSSYDIVYCHDYFTFQNIIASHFCRKYHVPYIVQPHGALAPVRQKVRFKNIKYLFRTIFNNVLNHSKYIVALTQNEKTEIATIYPHVKSKIKVIPNGIKMAEFITIIKYDLHRKYGIPENNKIVAYIGRIQYIKGIDITLHILATIKDKLNFTYLIIGPDEGEKNKLEKQIVTLGLENHILFTGPLEGVEKLSTIKSCDLFLFTSRSEGLPMTILEVAALGIPQIISENCNVPELRDTNAGFVIDPILKDKVGELIIGVLGDDALQRQLSLNSIKMIQHCFDLNIVCDKIENILK